MNVSEMLTEIEILDRNAFKHIFCKLSDILSRPQFVKLCSTAFCKHLSDEHVCQLINRLAVMRIIWSYPG